MYVWEMSLRSTEGGVKREVCVWGGGMYVCMYSMRGGEGGERVRERRRCDGRFLIRPVRPLSLPPISRVYAARCTLQMAGQLLV